MAEPDPPAPYQVLYSTAVERRLRELLDEAVSRGDGPAFAVALKAFKERLTIYPQFGDPQIDLKAVPGVIYLGIIRPLAMRYGVYEERRLVFVGSPPVLLPVGRRDASSDE